MVVYAFSRTMRRPLPEDAKWPNLFIVGVQKAGTTFLSWYLDQHPDIYMSRLKEPWFFSTADFRGLFPSVKDERAYLRLFAEARDERYRGEATVGYFWDTQSAALIEEKVPHARIVISLRDPITRAYSAYWDRVRYGQEQRSFDEVARDDSRRDPPASIMELANRPLAGSFYAEHLRRFLDHFGSGVHVVFFEELVSTPEEVAREVFRFLELDEAVVSRLRVEARNELRLARRWIPSRIMWSPRLRRAGRRVVPSRWRGPLEHALFRPAGRPPMTPDVRDRLRLLYEPDREAVEELLGRRAPW